LTVSTAILFREALMTPRGIIQPVMERIKVEWNKEKLEHKGGKTNWKNEQVGLLNSIGFHTSLACLFPISALVLPFILRFYIYLFFRLG
jgi:hypothetical protein